MCLVENKQQSDDLNDEKSFIRLIFFIFILLQQALSQMYLKRKKNLPIYDSGKMGYRVKRSNPVILFRSAMNTAGTGFPRG